KVDSISIGLGPIPEDMKEYDVIRGLPGSYKKSFAAAQKAKEYGFRVIMSAVVSHQNIHSGYIEKLLEISREMGVIFIFGLAVPAGEWSGNKDIILTEEDRGRVRELLLKYKHARTDFESNFISRGCGAVNEKLYITLYGDVIPCPFVQIKLGNIFITPLSEIRERALDYPIFKGYPERCLAADHYDFIENCLASTFDASVLPVDHLKIDDLKRYDRSGNKVK
ncbi:SPASM domain-containing protein, partial [Omnitrophica bacterium]|nr:SPASM domain-containing protein [Candidatus Omnitrophota bacterium]